MLNDLGTSHAQHEDTVKQKQKQAKLTRFTKAIRQAMINQQLKLISRGATVSLMACAALLIAPGSSHAEPENMQQAVISQNIDSQTDIKAMAERAEKLQDEGNLEDATIIWQRIVVALERLLGPNHPEISTALNNLGEILRQRGQYTASEPLHRRALAIREKALGPNHPAVAVSLINLGEVLRAKGQYRSAEPLLRRSLEILEKALGPDDPHVGHSLNNLASLLIEQGRYSDAEPLLQRSLVIREKILGTNHPDFALSLHNQAELLKKQGKYTAAEAVYRRSLKIYENTLGPDHPDVASTINQLASLLNLQGKSAEAENFYRRSLSVLEKHFGPQHPYVAASLNGLALLLKEREEYAEAESLYRRSLRIYENELGPNHPYVATILNNLAGLFRDKGRYSASEDLYRRSIAIYEKALGPDHPSVATSLNNLGELLAQNNQYAEAEIMHRRSLEIYEKTLGPEHSAVATSLNNIAGLLALQGHTKEAYSFHSRSLAIREKTLGDDHPKVAASLDHLAGLMIAQGQHNYAIPILRRSTSIESSWLLREIPFLSDRARLGQFRQLGYTWEIVFSWAKDYPVFAELALEKRLNRQGLLPEIELRQSLLLNAPNADRSKVEQLRRLTVQLSSVTLQPDHRTEVRKQRDELQAEIYRQIPELELKHVTNAEVARALPGDGVLVEFQRYYSFDVRQPKDQRWGEAQYIALVLKPDASVASVPLGPAATIDSTIHQGLRATAERLSDATSIWTELSEKVLMPLLPHLTGGRQWFLTPDGELNRVPFAALPAPQQPGTFLAQAVQLRQLSTGRELLKLEKPTPTGSTSLVMANPSYDRLGAKPGQHPRAAEVTAVAQQRSAELGSNQWKQLPASEREGQKVAKLLSTGLISGTSATTKALQRHQGPRVLHVATHGFFVADQEAKPTDPMRAIQEGSPLLRSLRQEDPQLRSGLVFAGANQPDVDPNDDGYLTAAEAVNLNLKGTELVVLSACSTGQGEVRTGEGVYGLQRSLTVAGARSTLLSLWKVDDAATAEFMARYYQRLKDGEGRSDALAAIQEEFRSGKVQSGTGVNWKEPYYWAAWQLVGDWRPIPGL